MKKSMAAEFRKCVKSPDVMSKRTARRHRAEATKAAEMAADAGGWPGGRASCETGANIFTKAGHKAMFFLTAILRVLFGAAGGMRAGEKALANGRELPKCYLFRQGKGRETKDVVTENYGGLARGALPRSI